MKHTIYFEPDGIEGRVDDGQTILDAARDLGIDLNAVCGGKKLCGKCRVEVKKGQDNLSPPGDNESNALGDELHFSERDDI
ncbi:MAG: 2Fe-2S iron-sulfur cluster binding domain-containing protein [Deltaproteobacteria bacterium]|nr:2Fe-2S iron-sulfur cluster binding domain-containing protein [Deltaproteobacteria bacterium]